ncbi:hypothetical protein [Flagellimonas lutimaris]|uniref:hypothetical protein n=1 Tax=Flagellimonas lutimaris TaxID=475082 RepID=UPI003F5CC4E2
MKNFKLFALYFSMLILMISCSDDDGNDGGFSTASLVGTWDLVAVNVSSAVDVNGDGSSSKNLLDEEDCISGSIVLKDDTTYQFELSNFNLTPITNNQYVVQCSGLSQATGAWASDGVEIVFQGSSLLGTLQLSNNTMIKVVASELPGVATYVYERR